MSIYRLIIFVLVALPCTVLSQSSLLSYEDKLQTIRQEGDINEKKYQLSLLVEPFKKFLSQTTDKYALPDTALIRTTKSSDSKYSVYYYNTFLQESVNRLDWYIVHGDINNKQVVHFFQNIDLKKFKSNDSNTPFQIELTPIEKQGVALYPLTITHTASMKIYKQYIDIASICMFEGLLHSDVDEDRLAQNKVLEERLQVIFYEPEYFDNNFEGLQRLSTLHSDDGKVKVCTWNVELNHSNSRFFGSIITKDKNEEIVQIPLFDKTESIRSPEKAQLTPKKWYGAVYYDIVTVKDKPNNYYVLLGYKPNNEMTKKKVIEALMLSSNNQVRFGNSVFQSDRYVDKRIIFEFSASANMMLRYERNNKRIVLDHLAPPSELYKDNYRFYGPDFSYDGYILEKGRWQIQKEIDVRNPKPAQ